MNSSQFSVEKNKLQSAEPVRILCAANAAYAAPLCVMLVSLLINHAKGRKIEIYVLATNLPEEDRRKVETSLCQNRPDFELGSLHWLSPSLEAFKGLHLNFQADVEVYARLLAPNVLPKDCDKVLYLDCDMVILSDLSPLYDSVCDGSAVHAARDLVGYVSEPGGVFNFADLGIPPKTPYFNSGVLLMNLRRWREQAIAERILSYLRRYEASVWYWDQGGMNAILHDSWTEIDPVWNQAQSNITDHQHWKRLGLSMTDWRRALYHPKIMHYLGPQKPWLGNGDPGYSYFFNYLDRTSYRDVFKGPRLERIIGFRLNYILWLPYDFLCRFLIRQRLRLKNVPNRWRQLLLFCKTMIEK